MRRWLLKQDDAVDEPDFPIATDAELQCTRTGQVLTDFKGKSVFDLNAERARELRAARETSGSNRSADRIPQGSQGATRPGRPQDRSGPAEHCRAQSLAPATRFASWIFDDRAGDCHSRPSIFRRTSRISKSPTTVMIGVDWMRDLASPESVDELLRSSSRIVLVNPRGMGETDPGSGPGRRNSPFGSDVKEAFLSILLDRPLLGQRVADILSVLDGLKAESGTSNGFQVVGVGAAGPIVLHAALLDEKGLIRSVVLERSLVSWEDVVEKGISRDQLGNVVPGVLQSYDLPDLAARLSPRPLRIDGPGRRDGSTGLPG